MRTPGTEEVTICYRDDPQNPGHYMAILRATYELLPSYDKVLKESRPYFMEFSDAMRLGEDFTNSGNIVARAELDDELLQELIGSLGDKKSWLKNVNQLPILSRVEKERIKKLANKKTLW